MRWKWLLALIATVAIGFGLAVAIEPAEAGKGRGFSMKRGGHVFRGGPRSFKMRPGRHSFYKNHGFKGKQGFSHGKSWQKAHHYRKGGKGKQMHAQHHKGKGGHYGNYRQRKHASYGGHSKGKGHYTPHQSRPKQYMIQTAKASAIASANTNVFVNVNGGGGGAVDVSGLLMQIWAYAQAHPGTHDRATYVDHRTGVQMTYDSEDCGCLDFDEFWEFGRARTQCANKGDSYRWITRRENAELALNDRCVADLK